MLGDGNVYRQSTEHINNSEINVNIVPGFIFNCANFIWIFLIYYNLNFYSKYMFIIQGLLKIFNKNSS